MEKGKVMEWLDRQIEADKIRNTELGNIRMCSGSTSTINGEIYPALHVYNCMNEISEALGEKINVEKRNDREYPYFRYIIYRGYVVFDISTREDTDI